jgi:hypothetical protein
MDQPEVDLLTAANVDQVITKSGTTPAGVDRAADTMSVMVIPTKSQQAARKLLNELRAYQETTGLAYIAEPLPNMPGSVVFEKKVVAEAAVYRGLYVSGNNVVRVTATQTPFTEENTLSGIYRGTAEKMLNFFPAQ